MSSRLLTIEGVYDGKSIQPLETVKTSKEFVYAVTDEIQAGLTRAGISEEEVLEDFNRFRRTLSRKSTALPELSCYSWQPFSRNRCHNKSRKKLATFFKFRRLFYSGEIPSGHGSHSKISVTVHRPDAFVRE
jgi:hypothetical protein